jgi:hypothetical protein
MTLPAMTLKRLGLFIARSGPSPCCISPILTSI